MICVRLFLRGRGKIKKKCMGNVCIIEDTGTACLLGLGRRLNVQYESLASKMFMKCMRRRVALLNAYFVIWRLDVHTCTVCEESS